MKHKLLWWLYAIVRFLVHSLSDSGNSSSMSGVIASSFFSFVKNSRSFFVGFFGYFCRRYRIAVSFPVVNLPAGSSFSSIISCVTGLLLSV